MKLHNLKPATGSVKNEKKRLGRGQGSGKGGTSTRGHKGAQSRSGYSAKRGFEGGQMPIIRRVAKRGFSNNYFAMDVAEVNLKDLERVFENDAVVDLEVLRKHGLASNGKVSVRILGDGELTKKLTVHANHFSKSAEEAIVAKGGRAVRVGIGEALAR